MTRTRSSEDQKTKNELMDALRQLTWDDLEDWAGDQIVSRGRGYHRNGAVKDLGQTPDGAVVAWVHGSDRYATRVMLQGDGEISLCGRFSKV